MVKSGLLAAGVAAVGTLSSSCGSDLQEASASPTTMVIAVASTGPKVAIAASGNRVSEEPWWEAEPPDPLPEPEPPLIEPQTFVFDDRVLYEVGSAELGVSAGTQLNHLLDLLRRQPQAVIEIVGHTDSTPGPTDNYNYELSYERARSIEQWLIAAGIAEHRISIDGRGPDEPVTSNDTEAGREANRRVEITVRSS